MRISDWSSDVCSSDLKRIGDTEMARPRLSDLIPIALALLLFGAFGLHARASDLVGHVYMQTNETQNRIMHFGRRADGSLKLLESIPTGGAGSGVFKPVSGQESAPNAFEGAGSVILAESNTLLFATNGGDNSVTSFRVSPDGKLTRSEERRGGKECVSTCRSRGSPYP